jgi:hypothetical protein
VRCMGKGHASAGGWPWATRGAAVEAGRRAGVACGAAAPWPERVVGPLFERVFLQTFVLKCIK